MKCPECGIELQKNEDTITRIGYCCVWCNIKIYKGKGDIPI